MILSGGKAVGLDLTAGAVASSEVGRWEGDPRPTSDGSVSEGDARQQMRNLAVLTTYY